MAYVGVIRGDMQGPIAVMDLEPVSRHNPPTEPRGQERRFGRPTPETVGAALTQLPAGIIGTVNRSAGLTVDGTNNVLGAKTASAGPTTNVTIPPGVYTSGVALVKAVNAAIGASALAASVIMDETGAFLVLQSKVGGTGSYIESTAGTFNTAAGLTGSFTVPAASAIISATSPIGGPINLSAGVVKTQFGSGGTPAQRDAAIGSIAPRFVETDAFIKSFQVGMLSGYRSLAYNPDPSRVPALTPGAAVSIVQDNGTTAYDVPLTSITSAAATAGDLTILGFNLGDPEYQATVVRVYSADGSRSVQIHQKKIQTPIAGATLGVISPTSIVIPAPLLNGLGVAGSKVQVQYTSLVNVATTGPNIGKPVQVVVT